jgi:oligoendopeptidase F
MPNKFSTTWDLSALFDSIHDPRIEDTLVTQKARAEAFAERYRGRINAATLTAQFLFDAVAEYESIQQEMDKPVIFAGLLFSADTSNAENAAFRQRMLERHTEISVLLLFFDIEIMGAPEDLMAPILGNTAMAHYAHHVKALRLSREHVLPEPQELILEEKANTAERAWIRFFDETVSAIPFEITLRGETTTLTEPEILNRLRDPDREVRRAAAEGLTKGLQANARPLTFVMKHTPSGQGRGGPSARLR